MPVAFLISNGMKVILLKDVLKLGRKGEALKVADGFARNYLIPKGLAKQATAGDMQEHKRREAREKERAERELKQAQESASRLDGEEVLLYADANEQGELYAALPVSSVVEALSALGHDVSAKQVRTERPIKGVGEHLVKIVFNDGIEAEVRVVVNAKGEEQGSPLDGADETENTPS